MSFSARGPTAVISNFSNGFVTTVGTTYKLDPTGSQDNLLNGDWNSTWTVTGGPDDVVRYTTTGTMGNFASQFGSWTPGSAESKTITLSVTDSQGNNTTVTISGAAEGPPPQQSTGATIFNGDGSTGNLSQWWYISQAAPGRITLYNAASKPAGAPNPRLPGTWVYKFHVLNSDATTTPNPRAQLLSQQTLLTEGLEAWEAWSLWIPSSFPLVPTPSGSVWYQFEEDYGPPFDQPAWMAWYLAPKNGVNWVTISGQGPDISVIATTPDTWMDFLVHKKYSAFPNGGYIEAWINGVSVVSRTVTQTMNTNAIGAAFVIGSYRGLNQSGFGGAIDTYMALPRVGTSRSKVEIIGGTR